MNAVITGMGIYIPEKMYTSEEVETMCGYEKHGVRHGVVKMITGVEERHYVTESENCATLAVNAAKEAMKQSCVKENEIDCLIFCSVTQDFTEPATANEIADMLNIRNAFTFDVKNGCNAFLQGMDIADSLIKTQKASTVLVVSGEALSRWVKFDYDNYEELTQRSPVTLSLGDAGGAFMLQGKKNTDKGILKAYFRSYPELWNNNVMWGGGVVYPQNIELMYIPGTTKPLIDTHVGTTDQFLFKILEDIGWKLEDVDFFASSQVAKWITETSRKRLGLPKEKFSSVLRKWGNAACSNIPLALYDAWENGQVKEGSKIIFIGGAVGFNACVMAIQL
ncbi:ketoacyl-ACP synthase III [Mediterraneibacter glycyrrhizinilyticus]|uniref:3-oxoacyl-ACP synthase III family protein n=1 Tax=Mediterraneibacter glycyrrhizinilyticus TaxID=342942 RepID=UPI0019616AC3|nr:ketoacyl-ACP synthase III [Mediterraneibacter glycyrrhizinilyticus]MBM6750049.1 ketoacyl-ACP synthase III [Mediterraneibacter glycyrrhizinilyticus]